MLGMRRLLGSLALLAVLILPIKPVLASELPAPEIQSVISQQIDAFRRDDAAAAYSFAAPSIKALFRSPDVFMAMVKSGYRPVYRPQDYSFAEVKSAGSTYVQYVDIVGPDGGLWTARYHLQRQDDGSLKITACHLVKRPGEAV